VVTLAAERRPSRIYSTLTRPSGFHDHRKLRGTPRKTKPRRHIHRPGSSRSYFSTKHKIRTMTRTSTSCDVYKRDEHAARPTRLRQSPRVSLWPAEHSIGLFLNGKKFDEVVANRKRKLNLHSELLDYFFGLTAGHVGAICLLYIVSNQVSLSETIPP